MKRFVKSADTSTPAANSRAELERVLRRYGATNFGTSEDYDAGIVRVFFQVPDDGEKGAIPVPIRLEVSIGSVWRALKNYEGTPPPPADRGDGWAQAERVAWRQLVFWVDAALSAASAGVQKISEAFLAHTLIRGEDGQVLRVVDQMDRAAGGSWKALLPPPGRVQQ